MQLGERLYEARVEKKLTIDEIAKETKIQPRYLQALEANDWTQMPGNFYVRAFVREYAEAVDLNGEELLEDHKEELPSVQSQGYQYVSPSRKNKKSSKSSSQVFAFMPKLFVFLLIVGIVFAIWYSYVNFIHPTITDDELDEESTEVITAPEQEEEESDESENGSEEESEGDEESNQEESDADESEEESEEESDAIEIETVEVNDSTNVPNTTYQVNNAEEAVLTLITEDETYLQVVGGEDNSYFEGMFGSGDSPQEYTIEEDEVNLNIGRASSLQIEVNGEAIEYEIEPDGQSGSNVHQRVIIQWNR
ncbi:helix-turn-helix domain-containing protein [Halalkalibacillus halophilus]|uniref:helix-turn-helix domain-containing protein n=1 Tax=Halalkalibacillus halophilus TaxID=392827 RepID=UPI00041589BD|nr:RodZ domain-containing protein [Halalkalibacillus halophilus]